MAPGREWGAKLLGAASLDWPAHAAEIERVRLAHAVRFGEPLSGVHSRAVPGILEAARVTHLGR